jgi:hypothetical protein
MIWSVWNHHCVPHAIILVCAIIDVPTVKDKNNHKSVFNSLTVRLSEITVILCKNICLILVVTGGYSASSGTHLDTVEASIVWMSAISLLDHTFLKSRERFQCSIRTLHVSRLIIYDFRIGHNGFRMCFHCSRLSLHWYRKRAKMAPGWACMAPGWGFIAP